MPVFSPAAPDEDADDEDDADEDDVAPGELELEEVQAASRTDAITSGTARPAVCLSCI